MTDKTNRGDEQRNRPFRRYAVVTAVATPANFTAYLAILTATEWPAWAANAASASALAVPTYLAYRCWAWEEPGGASIRGEILPYWLFTLSNVALASLAVAQLELAGPPTWVLGVAPLTVYTLVWLLRYRLIDVVIKRSTRGDQPGVRNEIGYTHGQGSHR